MIIRCCGRPRSDVPPRARGWAAAGAEVGLQPGGAAGAGRRHHPRQVQAAAEGGQRRGYRQPPHQVQGPYHIRVHPILLVESGTLNKYA